MICTGEDGEEELPFVAGPLIIDGLVGDFAAGGGTEELVATGAAGGGTEELVATGAAGIGGTGAELDAAGP